MKVGVYFSLIFVQCRLDGTLPMTLPVSDCGIQTLNSLWPPEPGALCGLCMHVTGAGWVTLGHPIGNRVGCGCGTEQGFLPEPAG